MNKRKIVIFLLIVIGLTLLVILAVGIGKKSALIVPSPLSSPRIVNPQGDMILIDHERYQIVYLQPSQTYIITIKALPFDIVRQEAEKAFLEVSKFSPQIACVQRVQIVVPTYIDPRLANQTFRLSFCESMNLFPSTYPSPIIVIDPNLAPLVSLRVSPPAGQVELGDTRNSISISFNQAVDPKTAYIVTNPSIVIFPQVRKDDLNRLILTPQTEWMPNATYTIRVVAGLRSVNNLAQTKEDIVLQYDIILPQLPNYTQEP